MCSTHTIIFDIDGTLVQSYELDGKLFVEALRQVLGDVAIHRDWARYEHVTDAGITSQIIREHGIRRGDDLVQQVQHRFVDLVEAYLGKTPCAPVPGSLDMLRQLEGSSGWRVGMATGGWYRSATAKLRSVGISPDDFVICSSDDHHDRKVIMKRCLAELGGSEDRVVYVGDGSWDLKACSELGWGFVAVGPRLASAHPIWVEDFHDPVWPDVLDEALRGFPREE